MATQCGGPVNTHHFVSSSGYYGYVPPAQTAASAPTQQQQHQQTMINGNHHHNHHQENGMDVDEAFDDRKMTIGQRMMMNGFGGRKRSFAGDELDIPQAYMPRFKRFREGGCFWAEDHGLAQMYHEPPLLCLSPAADFDMVCQPTVMTGNIKLQSLVLSKKNSASRCQELEDMLLLTHGCSSYHHYRQSTHLSQTISDNEEAEF